MKLIIFVGPDTLATTRYTSKRAAKQALNRASNRKAVSDVSCDIKFLGRRYSPSELREAAVLTQNEFFNALLRG
jgi:hypothetical protein